MDDYDVEETELTEEQKEAKRIEEELLSSLAASIDSKFRHRASQRRSKENQWIRSSELYYGKLAFTGNFINPETPFELRSYSDRPDVNVVRSKCSIAIAQTYSMQFGTGNKNWDLWPSKSNKEVDASDKAEQMSAVIDEQLDESNYTTLCWKAMRDRVVLGTGILKGPASVGKQVRSYVQIPGSTTWMPELSVDYSPELKYINPWFFFPDAEGNDPIELHTLSTLELKKLLQHEGFRREAIECVLERSPEEYKEQSWSDFAKLSDSTNNLFKGKYVVLEYQGPITRSQLDTLGIEPCYDSLNDEYYGEVWVCEGQVIRLELESIEASFRPPYYVSVWEKDPASVFGFGVPLMMEDAQRVVNETWHMILDNSYMSSGAQVAMHKHMVEPASGKWELGPGQIWYLTDPGTSVQEALQFFNVPNNTSMLIPVMDLARGFAEEESGIPLITAGLTSPQAMDSATGQLVIQQASTTLLDFMSEEWDSNITEPVIEAWYAWNMQNNENPDIKGQFSVDVRTSSQYKNKQVHIRDLEKLSVESAQNPELAAWINQPALQRVRLAAMNIPDASIVKTEEQYLADKQAAAESQGPDPAIMELQLQARKLDLEEARLAFEAKQNQQREVMEHTEKLEATRARLVESQARVAVSQNEKEIALIELAQRNEQHGAELLAKMQISRENNQTQAFLKSLDVERHNREATIKQQEADAYTEQVEAQQANAGSNNA